MRVWLAFVVGGVGTYLIRASFLALGARVTLPHRVERGLRHVGPAVFAAIAVPPVVGPDGVAAVAGERAPEVIAAVLAGLVAWRTGRVALVLVVGMAALWVFRAIGL